MPIRLLQIVRDAALVWVATFVAGFVVAMTLGEANRGTAVWSISTTLTVAVFCIGAFFASAHLATANRFVHVLIVAVLSAVPNWIYYAGRSENTLAVIVAPVLLMFVYALAGAGLSYVVRRSARQLSAPPPNNSFERTREG
jgi:hypothetical protein